MVSKRILQMAALPLMAGAMVAQSGSIGGPVSGLVFDGTERAIRPMIGVPGAAYLGKAAVSGLDSAAISPDGRRAVATAGGRLVLIRGLDAGTPRWVVLEENGAADLVAWNAESSAAAVWSAGNGQLRVWTDLAASNAGASAPPSARAESAPRRAVAGSPRLADFGTVTGSMTALALDAQGAVVFGLKDDGLYLGVQGRQPALIAAMADPSALALAGDSEIYVADRARSEVLHISGYREAADVTLMVGADRGVTDPVGLALSSDGKSLIVAGSSSRKIIFVDRSTRAVSGQLDLTFEPAGVDLLGASLYVLRGRTSAGQAMQVLDHGRAPAVYFVPAASLASATR